MSDETPQLSRMHRQVLAGLLIGGVAVAAAGAGMASTLRVWDLGPAEVVESLADQALGVWVWGNVLLGVGVAVTTAGLAALAAEVENVLSRSGGALAVVAGAIAAIAFLLQGIGNAEAADLYSQTGDIADGFFVINAVQEGLLVLFGGLAALGTIGIAIGSLKTDWLARSVGLTSLTLSLIALALLVLNIPFLALLGALVFGIALLTPTRRATTEPYGMEV